MKNRKTNIMLINLILALLICGPYHVVASPIDITSSGNAWPKLETNVDKLVKDLMKKKKLPGMTVAVTRKGKLIFTKGYGMANTKQKKAMKNFMLIPFGSVAKPLLSGAAGWQLMKEKPNFHPGSKLYGPKGVLGRVFESSIHTGVKRHTPIVALAISPKDRVYAWYSNGTVSSGNSANLDKHSKPVKFSLPPGKTPVSIRAIAIAKNSRVYVWYDDRTRSIGTSKDLNQYSKKGNCSKQDKSGCVSLPKGKKMTHIVGAGIAKSNDHVYIWYEDGTVSSGASLDFGKYFHPKPFKTAHGSGGTSYNIRGMGIAKNDHVYAWFANGKVSSGTSSQLHQYKSPYQYSMPARRTGGSPDDWNKWYGNITIQNLLDHRAGFTGADSAATAKLYGTPREKLTYEQIHKHFLMTRKLIYEPGTDAKYSNHGFGLWTLIIPAKSGKSYRSYVKNNYLKPMGLEKNIVPRTANPDYRHAWGHKYNGNGNPVPINFENATQGLAAGGFVAAAQDLAKLMVRLNQKYKWEDLDAMGWFRVDRDRLQHNGLTNAGGTSYVAMFPKGYKSKNNRDLSNINIAIITNIRTSTGDLKSLANKIVIEVPVSNVSQSYDIWKGKPTNAGKGKPIS